MKNFFKTTFLLALLTGLFLAIGYFLGGTTGIIIAFGLAIIMNGGMFWFSHKLVLKMQRAVPLDEAQYPEIYEDIRLLAKDASLPVPNLYFVDTPIPNAFATGRSPKVAVVAVTRGITEILNRQELRAVLAHELGHIKNRDMLVSTVAAVLGGAVAMLAEFAFWGGALFGGGDEDGDNFIGSLAMIIIAPIAAMLIQMAVSRSREYLADSYGSALHGNSEDLAQALLKLESIKPQLKNYRPHPKEEATEHLMFTNMFSAAGLQSLFSTHPKTSDRVARLRSNKK